MPGDEKSVNRVRVRELHALGPDTFTVVEDGEISLWDRETMIQLLKSLLEQERAP